MSVGGPVLIGWLSALPTGHAPTSPHDGLRQRLVGGCMAQRLDGARPLLVARSIGSAHHSGTPRTLRTAVLLIPACVVLGAVPDNGFMRPCAAVGDRSAW